MKTTELMKACGSKTGAFEPESIDQWRWLLANAAGEERALAWVKLRSLAQGSPFCVDEAGNPLRVASLAADLDWTLQNARNVATALATQGRIRLKDQVIWYRADVPQSEGGRIEGEEKYCVQSMLPSYLVDAIEKLPEDRKRWFVATYESFTQWRDRVLAARIAAARAETEQVENSIVSAVGLELKRLVKRRDDSPVEPFEFKTPDGNCVQSSELLGAREFVQPVYKPDSRSVQSGPSLLLPDTDSDSISRGPAAASSRQAETKAAAAAPTAARVGEVQARCAEIGIQICDRKLAKRLLVRFPKIAPKMWPRFPGQTSPGLWLYKSQDEMILESVRQQAAPATNGNGHDPEERDRVVARMKAANANAAAAGGGVSKRRA
jgi:hypothetical protein